MTDDQAWQLYWDRQGKRQSIFDLAYEEFLKTKAEIEKELDPCLTAQEVMREEWDKQAAKRKTALRRPWVTGWRA